MDNEIVAKMDKAAEVAAKEFQVTWNAQQVAEWIKKHKDAAGYKRLCYVLLGAFGLKQ